MVLLNELSPRNLEGNCAGVHRMRMCMNQRKESEWTYLGKIPLKNKESAESGVRRIKKT
jgi:hypothetical protein